jgi:PKD repeat protein
LSKILTTIYQIADNQFDFASSKYKTKKSKAMKKSLFILAVFASLFLSASLSAQDNPIANIFLNTTSVCVHNPVFFQDISTDPNGHTINAWLWDFGDGFNSTEQNPVHIYNTPGFFTVLLTVWNDVGGSASTQSFINVYEVNVVLSGGIVACNGETTEVIAQPIGGNPPYLYNWSNGGVGSSQQLPGGFYSVTVMDNFGCTAFGSIDILTSSLNATVTTTECLDSTGLGNLSVIPSGGSNPYTYEWSNGSNGSSLIGAPVGCHLVTVIDALGCTVVVTGCLIGDLCVRNVEGRVYSDANSNCIIDDGEEMQGVLVRAHPGPYYSYTNQDGLYHFYLDPGSYVIDVVNIENYSVSCPVQGYQNINVVNIYDTIQNVNLAVQPEYLCPNLEVYLNSSMLRPCFDGTLYVQYRNTGTVAAEDAYIELLMDEFMTYNSSTIPVSNSEFNLLTFDLGTLSPGQFGSFNVNVHIQCNTSLLGVSVCSEAVIYPNEPCVTDFGDWDHSSVSVEGHCQDDINACFTITNTGDFGDGDMLNEHEFRIFANDTLVHIGSFQLQGQEIIDICWPTEGRAIRLEADQHPEHPGNSHPQETIENCGDATGTSLGFMVTVPLDDNDAFVDIDCRTLTGSFDPNDKSVQPSGITANRYIDDDNILNYRINFQNTGTDTAFTVVITDTISAVHDMSTFVNGGSSHPCELEITGQGILKWTFNNILLPDSTTNEPESHGFVTYSIKLHPMTEEDYGTLVLNNAAIFFDFNPPVITNTTQLTFWNLPIIYLTKVEEMSKEVKISLYPNPAISVLYVESGTELKELSVFDVNGKKISTKKVNATYAELNLENYLPGSYLVRIKDKSGSIFVKKFVIR